uniref:Uncharacterized protein n=1 Tax=uncultured marine virus TaxID=186617 RepID=A0A0F7KZZ9_9VIRU|nr:hypothetical protein [uncultured marine virus]
MSVNGPSMVRTFVYNGPPAYPAARLARDPWKATGTRWSPVSGKPASDGVRNQNSKEKSCAAGAKSASWNDTWRDHGITASLWRRMPDAPAAV